MDGVIILNSYETLTNASGILFVFVWGLVFAVLALCFLYLFIKDNPSISNAYLNQPVTIDACIEDIRSLLNRLLLFTQLNVPVEHNPKQLYAREQEIKEQINKCEDIEILNGFYAELISILGNKNESRRNTGRNERKRIW